MDDIDFSWDRFAERVNGELVGNVGNFAYRSLLFAERNWDGTPEAPIAEEVESRIETAIEAFEAAINDYSLRTATDAAIELAHFGNEYIQRHEPWKLVDEDPEAAATVIRGCVQLTKAVAVLLAPTIPEKADELWAQLGEPGSVHDVGLGAAREPPPEEFGEPEELFAGVEDERVETLNEQLEERIEAAATADDREPEPSDTDLEPLIEERIGFEDFRALDIRVGEITAAEPIDGADELVRLEVDIGVETRQVVAGIRQLHDVEQLPGTGVVLLTNLEPAELFGVESNGMVLAAGEGADLLTTHGDAEPGTKIR
ncbi:MAG: class I tRNA ligase family protein, partial [Halobacteriales archaeon]